MKFILFLTIMFWVFMYDTETTKTESISISDEDVSELIEYYIEKNKEEHAAKASEKTTEENSTKEYSIRISY